MKFGEGGVEPENSSAAQWERTGDEIVANEVEHKRRADMSTTGDVDDENYYNIVHPLTPEPMSYSSMEFTTDRNKEAGADIIDIKVVDAALRKNGTANTRLVRMVVAGLLNSQQ